jgi:EmrB/QacA subfamily drug resistance transporter
MNSSRRWWALGALVVSVLVIGFDTTILNVALPTLGGAVHASNSQLQWIVDAYVLVFAGLLLPAGALGDRYGRKLLLVIGLAFFAGGSVVGALVHSPGQLIAVRAALGIGAAIITPISIAVLPLMFSGKDRGKAVALVTIGIGLGIPLGPLVGGYLLKHFWWGSIFLVNVPAAVLALIAVAFLVPESRDPSGARVDVAGAVLSTAGLVAFVYGVIEVPDKGWASGYTLGFLALGLVLLAGFVAWQLRSAYPMIDLALFRRPRFLWGSIAATLAGFTLFGVLFVVPQYLQLVLGFDALGSGLRLLPLMGGLIVAGGAGQRLASALGTKVPVALGLTLIAAGLFWGSRTGAADGYGFVSAWLSTIGLGVGFAMIPAMDAVLGSLPKDRAGSGTALTMTMRQVGGALGVAILGSVLAGAYTAQAPDTGGSLPAAAAIAAQTHQMAILLTGQHAYLQAMDRVLLVCTGVALAGAVLAAAFLPGRDTAVVVEEESEHELARLA